MKVIRVQCVKASVDRSTAATHHPTVYIGRERRREKEIRPYYIIVESSNLNAGLRTRVGYNNIVFQGDN